jgi:hypothetical protein
LVVIDEDDARSGVILPHRGGVVLVGKGPPEPSTCESAFAAGVERVASLPDEERADRRVR